MLRQWLDALLLFQSLMGVLFAPSETEAAADDGFD